MTAEVLTTRPTTVVVRIGAGEAGHTYQLEVIAPTTGGDRLGGDVPVNVTN